MIASSDDMYWGECSKFKSRTNGCPAMTYSFLFKCLSQSSAATESEKQDHSTKYIKDRYIGISNLSCRPMISYVSEEEMEDARSSVPNSISLLKILQHLHSRLRAPPCKRTTTTSYATYAVKGRFVHFLI